MRVKLPFQYEVRCYLTRLEKRVGICSKQYDTDKHALLWDFDDEDFRDIALSLDEAQFKYKLPAIYIVESSPNKYHAYCFVARPFKEIIHILSDNPHIDMEYLMLGIVRGYYTLRITPRRGEKFRLRDILRSNYIEELLPSELSISEYLTSNKGGKKK